MEWKYTGSKNQMFEWKLLLRIDGKFTASIPLLIKSSLMKCVLASVLRRSLQTGLNNLYWAVSKMMAVTLYSADS